MLFRSGQLQASKGNYENAIEMLERAVKGESGDPQLRMQLATYYQKSSRLNEARQEMIKALRLDPNNEMIQNAFAKLDNQMGRSRECLDATGC